jgi:hypothetical protein
LRPGLYAAGPSGLQRLILAGSGGDALYIISPALYIQWSPAGAPGRALYITLPILYIQRSLARRGGDALYIKSPTLYIQRSPATLRYRGCIYTVGLLIYRGVLLIYNREGCIYRGLPPAVCGLLVLKRDEVSERGEPGR